jgi:thiosulfate/3-mercaptopyruvate sulfurtransferase
VPTDVRGDRVADARTADRVPALVSVEWLRERLEDPQVLPVEVSNDAWTYYVGHVPGAVVLDWYNDLHRADRGGALDQRALEARLGAHGIDADTHLVLYGDSRNMFAAYAYWLLRYYQHARVSLLDGGRAAWVAAHAPMTHDVPQRAPRVYRSPGPEPGVRLLRDEVLARFVAPPAGRPPLDCRVPDVFAGLPGQTEADLPVPGHRLPGHIPGAVNLPAAAVLDPVTGRFRTHEELRRLFAAAGVRSGSEVAFYCSAGAESALPWFALIELLQHRPGRIYDGGWTEYGSLVAVPTR